MAEGKREREKGGLFAAGNAIAEKHGGAAAVRAIRLGESFRGLAAQEQAEVREDLEARGVAARIREQALRLDVAAGLYHAAMQKALADMEAGDPEAIERFDHFVSRFGWLTGKAVSAYEAFARAQKAEPPVINYADLAKELKNDARD